jgi:hypothetical protein
MSCIVLSEFRQAPMDDATLSLLWEALLERDGDLRTAAQQERLGGLVDRFARALAPRAQAIADVERCCVALIHQQRCGEFGRANASSDEDFGAILATVLLLAVLLEMGTSKMATEATARAVHRAKRLLLTSSPTATATLDLRSVYALAAIVCAKHAEAEVPSLLASTLPDPMLAARVVTALLRSDARERVDSWLAAREHSALSVVEAARLWATATNNPADLGVVESLLDVLRPKEPE